MKGLVASISSYKEAAEAEKTRRMTWEKEQEERFLRREAELEQRLYELQRQIDELKVRTGQSPSYHEESVGEECVLQPDNLMLLEANDTEQHEFVEGSSLSPEQAPPSPRIGKRTRSNASLEKEHSNMKLRNRLDRRPKTIQVSGAPIDWSRTCLKLVARPQCEITF